MSDTGVKKKRRSLLRRIVNIGVLLVIVGILAAIAIPNHLDRSCHRSRSCRVARDVERAVTYAIIYSKENGVYPTSLRVMREEGYANVPDKDPWGNDYVLSPLLTQGSEPGGSDSVYVFSRGPKGDGVYPEPFTPHTGEDGSIGYSSVHGLWGPQNIHKSPVTGGPYKVVLSLILYFILFAPLTMLALKAHEYFLSKWRTRRSLIVPPT